MIFKNIDYIDLVSHNDHFSFEDRDKIWEDLKDLIRGKEIVVIVNNKRFECKKDNYTLPNNTITTDSEKAAEIWAEALYKKVENLERINRKQIKI